MDCCNYVEAYAGGGHFYQQQPYFCYDNANPGYAGYEPPPISNAIEAAARYNGALPPAYPTDYVYNPKEARLRKAMREQSRELSRRSILQSAIARAGGIGGPPAGGGFLDHQHRFGCVSAATGSPLSMNSAVEADRIAEPWFQSAHRPKPIHSPRMADWYGGVGDPIERLQAMGAMHQRGIDKCKDVMRNQAAAAGADCAAGFSSSRYSGDFPGVERERELLRQESIAEYAEFEGQKWHPYQNGASPHQHPRTAHPSQMAGILHPNVQNTNSHGHGPWGQFCHGMTILPHVPTMARNIGIRGPRHAVFRQCGFSEENSRLSYAPNKIDVDSVRASYPRPEHQMPRLMESSVDSVIDSAPTRTRREEDEGTRWEPNPVSGGISLDGLVPASTRQESPHPREKEREPRRSVDRFEPKKKTVSKQPLPGFHQAFGSTEIGRFSRSEFFVNMVGESGGSVDVPDAEASDVSTDRISEEGGTATANATAAATAASTAATTTARSFDTDESEEAAFDDSQNELVEATSIGAYCGRPSAPRWHSPHVGVIGSEI